VKSEEAALGTSLGSRLLQLSLLNPLDVNEQRPLLLLRRLVVRISSILRIIRYGTSQSFIV